MHFLNTQKLRFYLKCIFGLLFFFITSISYSQPVMGTVSNDSVYKIVIAGSQYNTEQSHQRRWGTHYRKEWATPVKIRIVNLDTLAGGLIPYEGGGGRQSKTLKLRDAQGREYVLRSIDKSFGKALPQIYQGTFIESIIDDQASIAHPYSAITIAPMAEAAKIYHTWPEIIFIPEQPALDTFNKEFANKLYLFEQRPDENWETAPNFGNSKKIIGTEKLLEELLEDNDHRVDQLAFIRVRLFDLFIGDWGRHEDQWRWAAFKEGDEKIFRPVPRDRDQAFTKFDGKMLSRVISFAGFSHLQSFDSTIKDIATYNFPARNLDRRMANEPGLKQWIDIAEDLKYSLTDKVIEQAVRLLPQEVFPVSGNEMISQLKSRRNHLVEYATAYYKFIAKEVDIPGTDKKEFFEINRVSDNETTVKIYKIKKDGEKGKDPFYSRKFFTNETSEIRLYGMGDNDVFRINGSAGKGILMRIIGGKGKDSILDASSVAGSKKLTQVYDSEKTGFITSAETRLHISNDSALNSYNYKSFEYDDKGINVKPGLLSLTFGFGKKTEQWRKEPTGNEQSIKVKYSFNRAAVNIEYNSIFYQALGKWNAVFTAGAGIPSVVNFFGIGNESSFASYDRRYFRLRSHEYYGKLGINRKLGSHFVQAGGFYQTVKIKQDPLRFIKDYAISNFGIDLERKHFIGGEIKYKYQKTDDPVVPVKGFTFNTAASYTYNLNAHDRSFTRLSSEAAVYIPVFKFISLAFRAGGSTINGNPEFYQLNTLGSHDNLRGFRKQRFYGKQTAYSNNELRFIFNTRSKVFNGKMGLIGFYDIGRVWYPGEQSDIWHAGYGPGLFLSLFNKVTLSAAYGISKDDRVISAYVGFYF
jgi:hypothetical protein